MRDRFDFDKPLTEATSQNTQVDLVPKETMDDKVDFLKQFKEYWEFEKNFKYNSTFDTSFKKITKQVGLDRDQMNDVMKDLISTIIGNAAKAIGLDWNIIGDENYLFGFYKTNGSSKMPVLLVPYDFKFSSVKDKLIDWLYKQKKNEHKKPKLQLVETKASLGLSKKVSREFAKKEKSKIGDISLMTVEAANNALKAFASENYLEEFDVDEDPGVFDERYFARKLKVSPTRPNNYWVWYFPIFCYTKYTNWANTDILDENNSYSVFLEIEIIPADENSSTSRMLLDFVIMTYEPAYRAHLGDSKKIAVELFDSVHVTYSTIFALCNLALYMKNYPDEFMKAFDPYKIEKTSKTSTVNQILQEYDNAVDRLIAAIKKHMPDLRVRPVEELCEDQFDYDSAEA